MLKIWSCDFYREQSEPREVCFISTVEELAKVKLSRYRLEKLVFVAMVTELACANAGGFTCHSLRMPLRVALSELVLVTMMEDLFTG